MNCSFLVLLYQNIKKLAIIVIIYYFFHKFRRGDKLSYKWWHFNKLKLKRINFLYIVIILSFAALMIRLSYVKIIKGKNYYDLALDLWTRSAPIKGARGNIYDRNGNVIVSSSLAPGLVAIPKQINDKEDAANKLSKILNVDASKIKKHLEKKVSVEIIKPEGIKLSLNQALEVVKLGIEGIYVVSDSKRSYKYGNLLAPILGIVGSDNQGITGIEYIYDEYLRGKKGGLQIFTDAHGEIIKDLTSYYDLAESGSDLYLTIDLKLQICLERIINNIVSRYNPEEIMIIAMNPKNSEVLGMASYPTFDIINYQDYDQSLYNRNLPIWKSYEPGSVQKIITYAAGLEEKVFTIDEYFYDPGYLIVDGVRIKDWKVGGHGKETFLQVIQNSCNPGFMTIGLRLGKENLFKYIRSFGMGELTGIDLLGESKGILFNEKKIGNVELATASFGQGNAVTAIQLINASCAAVNGGYLYKPYVLKKIVKDDQVLMEKKPEMIRKVLSEDTSKLMCHALECVASLGTARGAYIDGYRVGGKTGTAQIASNGHYLSGKYILSFLGIAPMNDPQIAVYLAINNPKNTIQYGGVVAAPLVKEILQESFNILNIEPSSGGIKEDVRYYIDKNVYIVDDYVGMDIRKIRPTNKYNFIIEGTGKKIIEQLPSPGERLIEGGSVILYTN